MNVEQWLRARVASLLRIDEQEVDVHAPFPRFGIDSVEGLAITVELEELLERRLPTTLIWDNPTISRVARFVHHGPSPATEVPVQAPTVDPALHDPSRFQEYRELRLRLRLSQVATIGNPYFKLTHGVSGDVVTIDDRDYINFATYDYLGLSGHPRLVEAAHRASAAYGTSVSASRTTSGEKPIHRALEQQIARLLEVDDAVCFVGGYTTNVSFLGKFLGAEDLILHDAFAHDSVLQGARLSGAARVPFRHNDVAAAEAFLSERRSRYRRVLVVVEGIYSTDGDIPPMRELVALKQRYGAMLMVDEAHSIGVLGRRGGGVREHADLAGSDVDIWMGTLSKAFASCGGYIAGSRALVDLVKYTSPGFLYSVGMTPANAAVALEAIRVMREEPTRVRDLAHNAAYFREECQRLGLDTGLSMGSPIVPVRVGDTTQCLRLAQTLFRRGVHVTPMVHPAVPNDEARLRFFVSALHSEDQLRATAATTAAELDEIRRLYPGSFRRRRDASVIEPRNTAIAREGFEAFSKGDVRTLTEQLDERSRYFFPGRSAVAGVHQGPDAILDFLVSVFELTEGTHAIEIQDILSDETHGIVVWRNVAHRGDQVVDSLACEISDIDGERVTAATLYLHEQAAFDAFLGVVSDGWAKPPVDLQHAPTGGDEALRGGIEALLAGTRVPAAFATPDATVLLPPQLGATPVPLATLGECLAPLVAAGRTLVTDLAVRGPNTCVGRIVVSGPAGFIGTMCFVGECEDGKIVRAWLATDCDLFRPGR